jgi:hypothetical protein
MIFDLVLIESPKFLPKTAHKTRNLMKTKTTPHGYVVSVVMVMAVKLVYVMIAHTTDVLTVLNIDRYLR